jgi:hypothetical protein
VAKKVEEVLGPLTVLRNGEDSLEILLSVLQKSAAKRLRIYDGLESSYLTDRLARSKFFAALKAAHIQCAYTQMQSEAQLEGTIELGIRKLPPTESSSWAEAWVKIDKIGNAWAKKQAWPSAYSAPSLADRSSMYFYEKAILFWGTALQQMT